MGWILEAREEETHCPKSYRQLMAEPSFPGVFLTNILGWEISNHSVYRILKLEQKKTSASHSDNRNVNAGAKMEGGLASLCMRHSEVVSGLY